MLRQSPESLLHTDAVTGNRSMQLHAEPGALNLIHTATIDLYHHMVDSAQIVEFAVRDLPPEVIGYIYQTLFTDDASHPLPSRDSLATRDTALTFRQPSRPASMSRS